MIIFTAWISSIVWQRLTELEVSTWRLVLPAIMVFH